MPYSSVLSCFLQCKITLRKKLRYTLVAKNKQKKLLCYHIQECEYPFGLLSHSTYIVIHLISRSPDASVTLKSEKLSKEMVLNIKSIFLSFTLSRRFADRARLFMMPTIHSTGRGQKCTKNCRHK